MTRCTLPLLLTATLAASACGGDDAGGSRPELTVSAAASLKPALERYGADFDHAQVRFSFGGSDELAAQIRQGGSPNVYAAANTRIPEELFREGLVERPRTFAANRLVLAVPQGGDVRSLKDLERPGVDLVIGAPGVPVGSYTREVLDRIGARARAAILSNVRSNEPDVASVVGKLAQGAGDAGFMYVTDVAAAGGRLEAIELPRQLHPRVAYGIAVVKGSERAAEARRFVDGLLAGTGAEALRAAGFERR